MYEWVHTCTTIGNKKPCHHTVGTNDSVNGIFLSWVDQNNYHATENVLNIHGSQLVGKTY